jgi:hypothetical protein
MKVSLLWFALISGLSAQVQFATKGYAHGAYVVPWLLEGQTTEMPSELPGSSDYSLFVTDGISGAAVSVGSLAGYLNVGFQSAVMDVYGPEAKEGQIKPFFDTAVPQIKQQITKHEQLILASLQDWAPPAPPEGTSADDHTKIPSVQNLFGVNSFAGVALNNFTPKPTYEILTIGNCRFTRFSKVEISKDSTNYLPTFATDQTSYFPGSPVGFMDSGFFDEKMLQKKELEAGDQDVAIVASEGIFENTPMSLQAIVVNHVLDCMKEDKILDCVKELNIIKRFYRFLVPQWSEEIKKALLNNKMEVLKKPSSNIHRFEVSFDQYHQEVTKYREAKKKEQGSKPAQTQTASTLSKTTNTGTASKTTGTASKTTGTASKTTGTASKTTGGNNNVKNSPYAKTSTTNSKTGQPSKIEKFQANYVSPYSQSALGKSQNKLQRKGAIRGNLEEDPFACTIQGLQDPSDHLVLEEINNIALDYAFRFNKKCGVGSKGRELAEELLKCSIHDILLYELEGNGQYVSECVKNAIKEVYDYAYEAETKKDEEFGSYLSQAMVYAARSMSKEHDYASPYFIQLWKFMAKYYTEEELKTYPAAMKGKGFDVSMGAAAAILQASPVKAISAEDKSQIENEIAIQMGDIEKFVKARVQVYMDLTSLEEKLVTIEEVKGAKAPLSDKLKNDVKAKFEEAQKKKSELIRKLEAQDADARAKTAAGSYKAKFFSDYKGEELQYLYKDQYSLNKENLEENTGYDDHTFDMQMRRRRLGLKSDASQKALGVLGTAADLLRKDSEFGQNEWLGVQSDDGLTFDDPAAALRNDLQRVSFKLI